MIIPDTRSAYMAKNEPGQVVKSPGCVNVPSVYFCFYNVLIKCRNYTQSLKRLHSRKATGFRTASD